MIDITKIDGRAVTINAELIELIEEIPETVITLTTGRKLIVKESRQKVKNLVKSYKQDIFRQYLMEEQIE
ncbi:MAG: flagellar FlbD family protein [Lachnospiraceae bacterium]|nr:flagellar FlbD family protein [Lachnospiraceae bacterium]MBR4144655.1 flagellar FlbD family protein [Lachnospiraceae bacterium]MBR4781836.1 flagellar FlbD family protein [Lachnospiraceae bacterium]MBR6473858.1 flagellar FlbD family protein [Lachnospiraceae bacterium]